MITDSMHKHDKEDFDPAQFILTKVSINTTPLQKGFD
jgi:hypothetical protein